MITKDDIKKLSELARIELSGKEEDSLARDLQSILQYFGKLKEISADNIPAQVYGGHFESNLRKDEMPDEAYSDVAGLVNAAPEAGGSYIKVKPVFDRA